MNLKLARGAEKQDAYSFLAGELACLLRGELRVCYIQQLSVCCIRAGAALPLCMGRLAALLAWSLLTCGLCSHAACVDTMPRSVWGLPSSRNPVAELSGVAPARTSPVPASGLLVLRGGQGDGMSDDSARHGAGCGSIGKATSGWPVHSEDPQGRLSVFKEPLVATGAARGVRRAKACDLLLHPDATSISEVPFKHWRGRASFSVDVPVADACEGEGGMNHALALLRHAAADMLRLPRLRTSWSLTRFDRPFLGGSVALAMESLHSQVCVNSGTVWHSKDWTHKLQLLLPGALGFQVRGRVDPRPCNMPAPCGGHGGLEQNGPHCRSQNENAFAGAAGEEADEEDTSDIVLKHGEWREEPEVTWSVGDASEWKGVWSEGGCDLYAAVAEGSVEIVAFEAFTMCDALRLFESQRNSSAILDEDDMEQLWYLSDEEASYVYASLSLRVLAAPPRNVASEGQGLLQGGEAQGDLDSERMWRRVILEAGTILEPLCRQGAIDNKDMGDEWQRSVLVLAQHVAVFLPPPSAAHLVSGSHGDTRKVLIKCLSLRPCAGLRLVRGPIALTPFKLDIRDEDDALADQLCLWRFLGDGPAARLKALHEPMSQAATAALYLMRRRMLEAYANGNTTRRTAEAEEEAEARRGKESDQMKQELPRSKSRAAWMRPWAAHAPGLPWDPGGTGFQEFVGGHRDFTAGKALEVNYPVRLEEGAGYARFQDRLAAVVSDPSLVARGKYAKMDQPLPSVQSMPAAAAAGASAKAAQDGLSRGGGGGVVETAEEACTQAFPKDGLADAASASVAKLGRLRGGMLDQSAAGFFSESCSISMHSDQVAHDLLSLSDSRRPVAGARGLAKRCNATRALPNIIVTGTPGIACVT